MSRNATRFLAIGLLLLGGGLVFRANAAANTATIASKVRAATGPDAPLPVAGTVAAQESAVFAGGCFWGVQAVFQHTKGVISARSGYAGGDGESANYQQVSSGQTLHAEAVRVVYDPSKVSYETLLNIFFSVVHDPTQLNMQGPDHGPQYRSEVFTTNAAQQTATEQYINKLSVAKVFNAPIVTKVSPLTKFYEAEKYHQDYATLNPNDMYIVINDAPKVEALKKQFPAFYRAELK
ncbi:MAG: peptide-methionine (S)-S-oxide reductase MsrA [Phycisphaerae bacterium]|nr:peptide-methionine (S)-S-oxide reductase MsrA [Gemmatimonadaceae bacterium]